MQGRVCIWVGNAMIGDYDLGGTLCDVLGALKYPVHDCGNRNSDFFCQNSPEGIFRQLQSALFDGDPALESR